MDAACRDRGRAQAGCERAAPLPDSAGPQHDEVKGSIFRFAGSKLRHIGNDYPLHPSVIERFAAAEVLNYDTMMPYRPENLRDHDAVKKYYGDPAKTAS